LSESDIAEVKAGYDRWAAVYDSESNPMQALEEPAMQSAFGEVEGLAVLDLGCGTGRHALTLADGGAFVTALDFSEGMLAAARRKPGADAVIFESHDLRSPLPFADNKFDLVVSGLVLEHLSDLDALFAEIHRVLKPAGRSLVSAMHPAMFLRASKAHFIDPMSGELIHPGSIDHRLSDMIMSALYSGFTLRSIEERSPDRDFAQKFKMKPRSIGWPMVVVMHLSV
jgi:malonyl-CoA O-methyltransferase